MIAPIASKSTHHDQNALEGPSASTNSRAKGPRQETRDAQIFWVLLSLVTGALVFITGQYQQAATGPQAIAIGLVSAAPALLTWLALTLKDESIAKTLVTLAWLSFGIIAVSIGASVFSPLVVVFLLGPLTGAVAFGRRYGVELGVFSVIAVAIVILISANSGAERLATSQLQVVELFAPIAVLAQAIVLISALAEVAETAPDAAARQAQLQAERDEAIAAAAAKSRFIAMMAHELKTPLNAINGFSEIMQDELFGPLGAEQYKQYADDINTSGRHLLDLITTLLDLSRVDVQRYPLSIEPIDARAVAVEAVRLLEPAARSAHVALDAAGAVTGPAAALAADAQALRQILLNLLSNAVKFTPSGKTVRFAIEEAGPDWRFIIADEGPGISADALERLGQPFQQAGDAAQRAKGVGLGLWIAKGLAQAHGGAVMLRSVIGEGATAILTLPKAGPDEEA